MFYKLRVIKKYELFVFFVQNVICGEAQGCSDGEIRRMTAVLCHYPNSEAQGDRLLLWDLETDELLLDEQLEGYWDAAALREGVLTLEQYLDMGEGSRGCTLRLTETGPKLDRESLQDGQFRVGDYLLLWQDASILLDGEVLLQGSQPEAEEEEIGGAVYYNFHQALDAHRFLYSRAGWEWIEYYGIYDLEIRATHPILGGESRFGYTVLQVSADGKRALACYADEAGYWSPALVDLETFGQRSLSLGFDTVEEAVSGQLRASGSLDRLAVCDLGEDGVYRIRVFDTGSGAELFAWDVPESRVAGEPEIRLAGEDTLLVNLRQWKTDTEWVYRITFGEITGSGQTAACFCVAAGREKSIVLGEQMCYDKKRFLLERGNLCFIIFPEK